MTYYKSFWKRNRIWIILSILIISIAVFFIFNASKNKGFTDIVNAYSDTDLYNNAFEISKGNDKVIEVLGEIKPIEKSAILEGTVSYSKKLDTVNSSVRIIGSKARGRLDIFAVKINNNWKYNSLKIRIKKPLDKKQTIEILNLE